MFKISYALYYALLWILTAPPFWVLYRISDLLYVINLYIIKYRWKTIYRNLKNAFPEKSEQEIHNIAKRFYRHLGDFVVESIKTMHLSQKKMDKRYKFINPEVFEDIYNQGKHVVLVSGHYANWEWMIYFGRYIKHAFIVIYRPLKSKVADRFMKNMRSKGGAILIPQNDIFRKIIEYNSQGILTTTWFLADQRPPRSNPFWTTFLNQDTSFFLGGEKIANKLNAAVVFLDIRKVKRGHYEIYLDKLLDNTSGMEKFEVTNTYIRKLEKIILEKPEYWLWSHKRWKFKKPQSQS
ncbi:MAG: hypothetical protein GVY19_02200 [Bacteroidetes bacterium]|jgi:KDO2-lipid IV(A) lauroyltransferase|nr:hypothetical protein [Bacteroidota bacterium]